MLCIGMHLQLLCVLRAAWMLLFGLMYCIESFPHHTVQPCAQFFSDLRWDVELLFVPAKTPTTPINCSSRLANTPVYVPC